MATSWREPDDSSVWFTSDEAGIQMHWLPVPYSKHMSDNQCIARFFQFALGTVRKASSLPAEVVFAATTPSTIEITCVHSARRQKVPVVFEMRDLWPELPVAKGELRNPVKRLAAQRLEQFAYQSSAEIVTLLLGMAKAKYV
jgi:hypothetical protein